MAALLVVFPLWEVLAQTESYPDKLRWVPGFAPRFDVESGTINATAIDAMGRLIIAGEFDEVNGMPWNGIVRFRTDGTIDEGFRAPLTVDFPDRLSRNSIYDVAPQSDGKLVIQGSFYFTGGSSPVGLARLNEDGSLDPIFVPPPFFQLEETSIGSIGVQSDGKVLVAQDFSNLVRLNLDGSPDPGFQFGSNIQAPVSFSIQEVLPHPDGHIWLRGRFSWEGDSTIRRLVRLNSDGSIDLSAPPFSSQSGTIKTLVLDDAGRLLVGGQFDGIDGRMLYGLARFQSDGTYDPSFVPPLISEDPGGFDVFKATFLLDGRVLVDLGDKPPPGYKGFVRLLPDGALDTEFDLDLSYTGLRVSLPNYVFPDGRLALVERRAARGSYSDHFDRILLLDPSGTIEGTLVDFLGFETSITDAVYAEEGKWYVGGSWDRLNLTAEKPLVRLNSLGAVDAAFDPALPPAFAALGPALQLNRIQKLIRDPEGGLVTSFFSGNPYWFDNYDWTPRIWKLSATGELETTFQPVAQPFHITGMAFQSDGKLVANGWIRLPDYEQPSYPPEIGWGLSRMNADGSLDESFQGVRESLIGRLVLQPDGDILVATGNGVARYLSDGTPDPDFQSTFGVYPAAANGLALQADGKIVVAGDFTGFSGTTVGHIVRTNDDGSYDETFSAGTGFNAPVRDLLQQSDGKLIVAGDFTEYDGTTVNHLVRLHADGTLDSDFAFWDSSNEMPDIDSISLIRDDGEGGLLANVLVSGANAHRLMLFESAGQPAIVNAPISRLAVAGEKVVLSVDADSSATLSYQWRFNGVDIVGANQATLTLGAAQTFQTGNYSVVVSTAEGVVESEPALVTVDAVEASDARLINISTRGFVREGGAILIPGLAISGGGSKRLLIRAVGPSLEKFGVTDLLADPKLTIFAGQTPILSNDNWGDNPEAATTADVAANVGAFTLSADSKDAALVVTLPSGLYTIHVQGVDGQMGVALAEVYEVSPK